MHPKGKFAIFAVLLLVVALMAVGAQDKKDSDNKDQEATAAEVPVVEGDLSAGVFIYKPMGRRDPFWDLLRGKNIKNSREAIDGIEGLMIDELDLEGTFFFDDKFKALLKGPDGLPYIVSEGQKVYDGELISIDRYTVVFKKILTVALGGKKEKIIEKRLNPDEEEGIK